MLELTKELTDKCDSLLHEAMGEMVAGTLLVPEPFFATLGLWGFPHEQFVTARREYDVTKVDEDTLRSCIRTLGAELRQGLIIAVEAGRRLAMDTPHIYLRREHFTLALWAWVDCRVVVEAPRRAPTPAETKQLNESLFDHLAKSVFDPNTDDGRWDLMSFAAWSPEAQQRGIFIAKQRKWDPRRLTEQRFRYVRGKLIEMGLDPDSLAVAERAANTHMRPQVSPGEAAEAAKLLGRGVLPITNAELDRQPVTPESQANGFRQMTEQWRGPTIKEEQTLAVLQELARRQGHDLCHYEPEAIEQLMKLYGVQPPTDLRLPARKDFRQGCRDYECFLYGPDDKPAATTPAGGDRRGPDPARDSPTSPSN
jgi:hypothetical protein